MLIVNDAIPFHCDFEVYDAHAGRYLFRSRVDGPDFPPDVAFLPVVALYAKEESLICIVVEVEA